MPSAQIFDKAEFLKRYKEKIFKEFGSVLQKDDPIILEVELISQLLEEQQQTILSLSQNITGAISDQAEAWDKAREKSLDLFKASTSSLSNDLIDAAREIYSDLMYEAIKKAQSETNANLVDDLKHELDDLSKKLNWCEYGLAFICGALVLSKFVEVIGRFF